MTQVTSEDLELFHYGVKGMKWGVRRSDEQLKSTRKQRYKEILSFEQRIIEVTTKNGKTLRAVEEPNSKLSAFISSLSKTGVEDNRNSPVFKIEADGKRVGEAIFNKKSSEEINLVWLGVKESERGQGYASAIFDAAVNHGKQEGVSKLTLEVPGNAPDARHIYEKRGFKVTKEPSAKEIRSDSIWGGLTHMELDLTQEAIRHAASPDEEELERALIQTFPQLSPDQEKLVYDEEDSIEHSEDLELFHYGVKGMRWGVRKEGGSGRTKKEPTGIRKRLKDRDNDIKAARNERSEAQAKEKAAYQNYKEVKATRKGDRKNPEKKANTNAARDDANRAFEELQGVNARANRMTTKETIAYGALRAAPIIIGTGYLAAGTAATRRNAAVGQKAAAAMFADTRGISAPGTIALNLVDGVWQ